MRTYRIGFCQNHPYLLLPPPLIFPTRRFFVLLQNLRLVPLAYLHPVVLRQVARPFILQGDAFLLRAYAFRLYTFTVRERDWDLVRTIISCVEKKHPKIDL